MNEETKKMNVHEKLTHIQCDLLSMQIDKSGKNNFGGFSYYNLDDLLPPVLLLCKDYNASIYFNFPCRNGECEKGQLIFVNNDKVSEKITIEIPFVEMEKLPKMNMAQVSGTYQTYMKRYLILNLFGIVEDEIIDASSPEDFTGKTSATSTSNDGVGNQSAPKKSFKKAEKKPKVLDKVIQRCHEDYSEEECNKKLLNKVSFKMLKDKEISKAEREEIYEYLFKK